jgi:hypothetical protein
VFSRSFETPTSDKTRYILEPVLEDDADLVAAPRISQYGLDVYLILGLDYVSVVLGNIRSLTWGKIIDKSKETNIFDA